MFEIRKSEIHGLGLFATVDIPENSKIVEYTGTIMLKKELNMNSINWS